METVIFHTTVNATVIGRLRAHRDKYRRTNERKRLAFAEAQRLYLRKKRQAHEDPEDYARKHGILSLIR